MIKESSRRQLLPKEEDYQIIEIDQPMTYVPNRSSHYLLNKSKTDRGNKAIDYENSSSESIDYNRRSNKAIDYENNFSESIDYDRRSNKATYYDNRVDDYDYIEDKSMNALSHQSNENASERKTSYFFIELLICSFLLWSLLFIKNTELTTMMKNTLQEEIQNPTVQALIQEVEEVLKQVL